tara:strand:+ start:7007 stop:7228 length:222 start_codon:yes stop_codon:yes gene_type:complete
MNDDFKIESMQKFIYNVLGGSSAIWGSSEILKLRNKHNKNIWRIICGNVGLFFFGFYLHERIDKYNILQKNKK